MPRKQTTMSELPPPSERGPDPEVMLKAWNINVATQKKVLGVLTSVQDAIGQVIADNRETRRRMGWLTIIVVTVCLFLAWRVGIMEDSVRASERASQAAIDGQTRISTQVASVLAVANAVLSSSEADREAHLAETEHKATQEEAVQKRRFPSRPKQKSAPMVVVERKRANKRARLAKVAVMEAEIVLAPDGDKKDQARSRLKAVLDASAPSR